MKKFFNSIEGGSQYLFWIGGAALGCCMFLTVFDVILRIFRRPIVGVYDIVGLLGGIFIGFAIPSSTWKKVHISMAFLTDKVSSNWKKSLMIFTRCLGIFLFLLLALALILHGIRLYRVGEVSLTMHLPTYPIILGIGGSCLFNSLVLLYQLVVNFREEGET